jgi:hypothetical protein
MYLLINAAVVVAMRLLESRVAIPSRQLKQPDCEADVFLMIGPGTENCRLVQRVRRGLSRQAFVR